MYVKNSPTELMGLSEAIKKLPPAPPGYIWVYEADGLSGLGRFSLKKIFKKVSKVAIAPIKAVMKVSEKIIKSPVGKIALLGAAAWYAAPWFATLAKSVGAVAAKAIVGQRTAGMTADEAARAENELSTPAMPEWAATAGNLYIAQQQAKLAAEQSAAAQARQIELDRQNAIEAQRRLELENSERAAMIREAQRQALYSQGGAGYVEGSYTEEGTPVKSDTPAWLIPAAIGGAALLLLSAQ